MTTETALSAADGDALLTNGDGLLVEGTTLFAVQNRLDELAAQRPQVELGVQDLRDRRDAAAAKASALTEAAAGEHA